MFYFCLNDCRTDLGFLWTSSLKIEFCLRTKCQMAKYQYCKWSMSMQWFYVVISRKSRQYPSVLRMTWKRTKLEASQLTLSSVQLSVLLKCGILTIKDIGFLTILSIPHLSKKSAFFIKKKMIFIIDFVTEREGRRCFELLFYFHCQYVGLWFQRFCSSNIFLDFENYRFIAEFVKDKLFFIEWSSIKSSTEIWIFNLKFHPIKFEFNKV